MPDRGWLHALALVVGAAFVAFGLASADPAVVADRDQRAVTIATLPCSTELQSNSSGVVVDDRTVVTVAHALFEARDWAVRDAFGEWHRGEIVYLDLGADLAVVRVEDLRATPMALAPARPVAEWVDEPVRLIEGAASGSRNAVVNRRVRLTTETIGDHDLPHERLGYELAVDIAPGDSGAPIVDRSGSLVAMVFARSTSRPGIAWATAIDEIEQARAALAGSPDALPAVATWPCDPPTSAELQLTPPTPARLAG